MDTDPRIDPAFESGHYYSPVVATSDIVARVDNIWPATTPEILGIDWNLPVQRNVLEDWFPPFVADYDYPDDCDLPDDQLRSYYSNNSQFGWLDSRSLFVFLRRLHPKRMVEVGSGYSTLLATDVNRRFLGGSTRITCIEPYPRPFLFDTDLGIELLQTRVELMDPEYFRQLESGDILFIDSSHVSKTGSDVNFLLFEVLPRLAKGVFIHLHDIPLPDEYPKQWVIAENRSWNELYVVRALLMYSTAFQVVFSATCAYEYLRDSLAFALGVGGEQVLRGSSLWLQRQ